jgi:hypothetical protein
MRSFSVEAMAKCEADELDLGRVGLYMYQQVTRRYVLLRCDCVVSGFYLTGPDPGVSKQVFGIAFKDACSASRKRGLARGGVIASGVAPPRRKVAYPMTSFPKGPQTALIMPFESQRAGCCSQGDIRAEGCAFIGLTLRGKELAKGLSHATARLGLPLMLG